MSGVVIDWIAKFITIIVKGGGRERGKREEKEREREREEEERV